MFFSGLFRSFSPTGSNQMHSVKIGEILPSRQSFFSLMRFIYYGDVDMPVEDSLYLFTAHAFYIFSNNRLQVYCKHNLGKLPWYLSISFTWHKSNNYKDLCSLSWNLPDCSCPTTSVVNKILFIKMWTIKPQWILLKIIGIKPEELKKSKS